MLFLVIWVIIIYIKYNIFNENVTRYWLIDHFFDIYYKYVLAWFNEKGLNINCLKQINLFDVDGKPIIHRNLNSKQVIGFFNANLNEHRKHFRDSGARFFNEQKQYFDLSSNFEQTVLNTLKSFLNCDDN